MPTYNEKLLSININSKNITVNEDLSKNYTDIFRRTNKILIIVWKKIKNNLFA